jgi:CubicO group peptidase (beta-lactamase class C family)
MTLEIHGVCDPRFGRLKDSFASNFDAGLEVGASLAVMRHGEPLVDLWAGYADFDRTRPWGQDTIVVLMSSTKIALILAFLILIDRGLVDLDATVATYWPEFAAGGKDRVTVREAMTHRAGVPEFNPPISLEQLLDWEVATAKIAAQAHWFGGESRIAYHPVTYGYLLGEIMRRVDGRRPAQFFREEIAGPAGIDLQIGLRSKDQIARLAPAGVLAPTPPAPYDDPVGNRVMQTMQSRNQGPIGDWARLSAENPGGNGYSTGRGIARLGAIGAANGVLDGVRYLSEATLDEAFRLQASGRDWLFGQINLGLGLGLEGPDFRGPTPSCVHWGGAGGSFGVIDRRTGVSAGYAMNNLIFTAGRGGPEPRFDGLWAALGDGIRSLED